VGPESLLGSDVIFIFVKSYSTAEVMNAISEYISADTVIVTLQNGLGNYEAVKSFVDEKNIVLGSTTEGAAMIDGRLVMGGSGITEIGGADGSAVEKIFSLLTPAGINCMVTDDPFRAVWKKAVVNSAINPPGAVLNMTNGELIGNENSRQLLRLIVSESVKAAAGAGIDFDAAEMTALTENICVNTAANRCSMLQDISAGRRTEIDSINGRIIEAAEKAGQDAPVNRAMYLVIKSLEAGGIAHG
jgi:2-dehydropantoate 2-reductase